MLGASPSNRRACRRALAATQLALAREHRLASLGALATAAAHELGTPLGTIAVVARELERALPRIRPKSRMSGCCAPRPNAAAASSPGWPVPKRAMLGAAERLPLGALLDEIASDVSVETWRSRWT